MEQKFKLYCIKEVPMREFIQALNYCKKYRIFTGRPQGLYESIGYAAFLEDHLIKIELTYKNTHNKVVTLVAFKDGRPNKELIRTNPLSVWANFNKNYYSVPRLHEDKQAPFSSRALLYYNEDKNINRYHDCIGYDINSAYAYAMANAPLPNTEKILGPGFVQSGQIGFDDVGKIVQIGSYAYYRFELLDNTPFKKFAEHWYKIKRDSKDPLKKKNAKDTMNIIVGYFQKYNCFLRSAIVEYCNDLIQQYIDKYKDIILYCNTDSIVATSKINELKLGRELGEWKIEHKGDFAYINYTYQWNKDKPTYRGISKEWFKKDFDLLKDEIPHYGNVWEYDEENMKMRRINYEEEKE